jgi:hypothetical protein
LIVRNNDLDEIREQILRFYYHPYTSLRPLTASNNTRDVALRRKTASLLKSDGGSDGDGRDRTDKNRVEKNASNGPVTSVHRKVSRAD